ncbi:hypothetical protein F5148DRAFT_1227339 [Russula earlei]|uniref:Uncharacterized protein n=1 Tax=Russula earlei TaxID=71964 RepID=A0ACC0TZR2_9AGAM|nr:hypothetical protein F5148DRAFT_1227339 [Russula earlei]
MVVIGNRVVCCHRDLRRRPSSAPQLERWLNDPDGPTRTFKFRVERMLSNLLEIACDKALDMAFMAFSKFRRQSIMLYTLHEDGGDFRDRERAAAIPHLRTELRQVHKDIRLNTRVCKHSWAIINAVHERKVNLSLSSMTQRVAPKPVASGKNAKRKKRAHSDDGSGNEKRQSSPQASQTKRQGPLSCSKGRSGLIPITISPEPSHYDNAIDVALRPRIIRPVKPRANS